MAGLGTACGEEAEDSFGTLKSAFGLELAAGLSEVLHTKHKTCGEDKCSVVALALLWDMVMQLLTS
jgi:hypothetical protein